jgi:hypothetical protein
VQELGLQGIDWYMVLDDDAILFTEGLIAVSLAPEP